MVPKSGGTEFSDCPPLVPGDGPPHLFQCEEPRELARDRDEYFPPRHCQRNDPLPFCIAFHCGFPDGLRAFKLVC